MTFTKFNEFSYGALYMLSSHAQLALCLSVLFFSTWYAVHLEKEITYQVEKVVIN